MFEFIRRLREFGLEGAIDRYYSKYPGLVVRNDDPQQQGRVKLKCEPLGRTDELLHWAYPVSPFAGNNYGFYFPPEVDDNVWVWFENGEPQATCYAGSWYGNNSSAKQPSTSEVPAEFRSDPAASVTRRGIKTKRGHGLQFEDVADNSHVVIWSGSQETTGEAATKNRYVLLQDSPSSEKQIVIASSSGHKTEWRDVVGEVLIKTTTADGHSLEMNDSQQFVEQLTKGGHSLRYDDAAQYIELKSSSGHVLRLHDVSKKIDLISADGHQITLDDATKKILVQSAQQRQIALDDAGQQITVQNLTGQTIVMDGTGTTVTEPGDVTVTAIGNVSTSGQDINSTALGNVTNTVAGSDTSTIQGAATKTFASALNLIVSGSLTVVNSVLEIAGSAVGLGPAPRFQLVDVRFFAAYLAHTHNTTIAGAPTGPPITGIPSPGSHTTINTTAS